MTMHFDTLAPLFVPGDRPDRIAKAAVASDAIIIDFEDAIAGEAKAKAKARQSVFGDFRDVRAIVRINGIGTPWHEDDVEAVSNKNLVAIMVPKAEDSETFRRLCTKLKIPVIALIESARGLADARSIAILPNVERIAFGSIDFCADLGCAHTREILMVPRQELILASRLANLSAPLDGVTTSIDDPNLILSDSRHASDLGFGGKLCIHPRQIPSIREGFAPQEHEVAWAHKVLASGDGAASVDGAMVDEPVRIRARSILKRIQS